MVQSNYKYQQPITNTRFNTYTSNTYPNSVVHLHKTIAKKKRKEVPFVSKLICFLFCVLLAVFVLPYSLKNITKPIFLDSIFTNKLNYNYHELLDKTNSYLANDYFIDKPFLKEVNTKKPQMQQIYESSEMVNLTSRLNQLAAQYPTIKPSIYVWDFSTSKYVNIRANELYSAASIIKIPVLLELFKSVEKGQIKLTDTMTLTDYYRAEGSGDLQYRAEGSKYTMDELARVMIENSDNSATNMIMSALGGSKEINRAIRKWGLKTTYIQTWLPDLTGTNYTTAKDMATMLFNIENDSFLSLNSKEYIVDYMGHVKNTRLLKAGLPDNAQIIHKTGDIGKTLGDAGTVFMPNGRRYIVVIFANRPHNAPAGREFIAEASSIIYNYLYQGLE